MWENDGMYIFGNCKIESHVSKMFQDLKNSAKSQWFDMN